MRLNIDNSTFTYYISQEKNDCFSNHYFLQGINLWLSYSSRTDIMTYTDNQVEVVIIGLCVDSHLEYNRENIPAIIAIGYRRD